MHDPLADPVIGANAYSSDGVRLGVVTELFLDDDSGDALFLAIKADVGDCLYVLAENAVVSGDSVVVPYSRPGVTGAPAVSLHKGLMTEEDKRSLLHYFGRKFESAPAPAHRRDQRDGGRAAGAAPLGGVVQGAAEVEAALTLSRERLVATSQWVPYERVRLRKYVTTEMRTITVAVRTEHLAIETDGVVGESDVTNPPEPRPGVLGSGQRGVRDIVLHEERPIVHLAVVPVERIRVSVETEESQETVTTRLRTEAVAVDELT